MESWNQRYISKPCNYTKVYNRNDLETVDSATKSIIISNKLKGETSQTDINPEEWLYSLLRILNTAKSELGRIEKNMRYESKFLSAYVYQNGSLKREKFMQAIKKVGKCLKRWMEVDLCYLLSDVLEMIPSDFFYIKSIRLPSTHCMYYLLQRLVATFYLLLQCASYCMEAVVYFRAKLLSAHFIGVSTLGYGIVARVRTLSLKFADSIATANDKLHPYIMALVQVFPHCKTDILPHNLKEELANLGEAKRMVSIHPEKGLPRSDNNECNTFLSDEEDEEKDENPDNSVETSDAEYSEFNISLHTHEADDVGEQVSHEKFEAMRRQSQNVIEAAELKTKSVFGKEVKQEIDRERKGSNKTKRKRLALGEEVGMSGHLSKFISHEKREFSEVTKKERKGTITEFHNSFKKEKIRYFKLPLDNCKRPSPESNRNTKKLKHKQKNS